MVLEDRALVRLDRGAQVLDRFVVLRCGAWPGRGSSAVAVRPQCGGGRPPRAVERVELDVGDRLLPVAPAIDRTLDHVAQLAHVARPRIFVELAADVVDEARPGFPTDLGGHAAPE